MKDDLSGFLPLSPALLHILLALAGEARHSEGKYRLGPGTLYDNLQKLVSQGLAEEAPRRPLANDDPRRRYYRLTPFGRSVLKAEIARLESVVQEAKLRLRSPSPRRVT